MIPVGSIVKRINSDYTMIGTVVANFLKTTGQRRIVVEDDRGILFIMNESNVEVLNAAAS